MISIVIPIYNAENFLPPMLDSILNQSYQDFEIILVNDGSKDNSSAVCHNYAKQHSCIRVFDRENGGASAARNFGAQQARGEFLWFMDSDDLLPQGVLETAVSLQREHDADLVIGGMDFVYTQEGVTIPKNIDHQLRFHSDEFGLHYSMLFGKNYISSLWNKLIRRSIITQNGLEMISGLQMYEDYVYCMDLLFKCRCVVCTPTVFYQYMLRDGHSLSRRYRPGIANMFHILHEKIIFFKKVFGQENVSAQNSLDRLLVYLAYECVKNEARSKETPIRKIREMVNSHGFRAAMQVGCTGALRYRVVHFLMKHRCVQALWLYMKLTGKNR